MQKRINVKCTPKGQGVILVGKLEKSTYTYVSIKSACEGWMDGYVFNRNQREQIVL